MPNSRRRCFEAGHRLKFLVVIDETPECERALYFAARRAARTGAGVVTLSVIAPEDFQQLFGVGDIMRAEAEDKATALLDKAAAKARSIAGIEPERVIREGAKADAIVKLIEEDEDIAILVLAAGVGTEGPGPLVASLASKGVAAFPIPVTIVPGSLQDADIDALA
jgi:nucleotide-binding universal stress UspA family protein